MTGQTGKQPLTECVGQKISYTLLSNVPFVSSIARKLLVTPVAGKSHLHMLASGSADAGRRKRRAIAEWLVIGRDQRIERQQVLRIDLVDHVSCMKSLGDVTCIGRFVKARNAKLDRKTADGLA